MDPYDFDESVRRRGGRLVAGVDEAGRGPIAGPVVAAAVILPPGLRIEGVRDSKVVPRREREALYRRICGEALAVAVSSVEPGEIDRINILCATKRAMKDAVMGLGISPDILLVDALSLPEVGVEQMALVKGDAKSASIAAASIVAKVVRDAMMEDSHARYPQYGFDRHKGYATRAHLESIARYGPCPLHRKTFQPVSSLRLPFA